MNNKNVLLETDGLSKNFGDIRVLDQVSLQIRGGEIQGLIGENGSGKSTISNLIHGMYQPTEGKMKLKGKPYQPKSPLDARANNITMIVQEKDTIDMLSVAENIFLGNESMFRRKMLIDTAKMNREARKALENIGITDIDVTEPIFKYDFETRKLIEIAKALYYEPELMIVDETTTALSQNGRMKIYKIMKRMKDAGKAVLFISHDLPELMEICDCLTVLRDGKLMMTIGKESFSEDHIKKAMVGRTISKDLYRSDYQGRLTDKAAIQLTGVSSKVLDQISLEVYEGEIVGIGGLSGAGIHEIGKIIAGIDKKKSGSVKIYDEELRGIQHAFDLKVGYISKDRDVDTLLLNESIQDNLSISAWNQLRRGKMFILPKDEKRFAEEQIENLHIKCSSGSQLVRELSGGNKQKVSFGKLIGNNSRVLILDSPTRGVDIGVKTTMYELIHELKQQGNAILIISEELPELIGMCDRILILKDGKISGKFERNVDLKEVDIINHMI